MKGGSVEFFIMQFHHLHFVQDFICFTIVQEFIYAKLQNEIFISSSSFIENSGSQS